MQKHQKVIVLDFGGQYNQLIVRRIRDLGVYAELLPYSTPIEKIKELAPIGIIFTGGPNSVFDSSALAIDKEILDINIPILGICYGCQLIAHLGGGVVKTSLTKEYGKQDIVYKESKILDNIPHNNVCWMSHTDYVDVLPTGFTTIASTPTCQIAALANESKRIFGVQFHPEVAHTVDGLTIIKNFLYNICAATGDWTISNFVSDMVAKIKEKVGDKKVLCAMSGGVDSAVAATLIHKAVGSQLTSILVNHGLMRKNECAEVMKVFRDGLGMKLILVDAEDRFLTKLAGITDPETKRKTIGAEFIRVFEDEAKKIGKVDFLVQGTIYPDIIESGFGNASLIKSHHNVGGLPSVVDFEEIIEPLKDLFKDEVRKVGFELGLSKQIVMRQPFPGPGLGIRIIGDITKAKLDLLRDADAILREEIIKNNLDSEIWQYFAVLTNMRSVGVMGDMRTYDYTLALRAITSIDAMTADWARIPYPILEKISTRIVNECKGINRIVYDITSKPPATIEWE